MKRFVILSVLVILTGSFFTGCQTTVPHDTNASTSTTSSSHTYSK